MHIFRTLRRPVIIIKPVEQSAEVNAQRLVHSKHADFIWCGVLHLTKLTNATVGTAKMHTFTDITDFDEPQSTDVVT